MKTPRRPPTLRFTPTAWAKLLFLRDAGETEIGGFGIAAAGDLLLVEDVALVKQECTPVEVRFDDAAVADFFDDQVEQGRRPEEFGRVWIHTHPGSSAQPSGTDEETFTRVFGGTDWAVMFILARGGETYGRLRYHVGPGADIQLPVEVVYSRPFAGSDQDRWLDEYDRSVREMIPAFSRQKLSPLSLAAGSRAEDSLPADGRSTEDWSLDEWYDAWLDYVDASEFPREAIDVHYREL